MKMKISINKNYPDAERIEPDDFRPLVEKVLWADHSKIPFAGFAFRKHLHHFHQLDVILGGEFKLVLEDGERQIGRSGDAWIIPPLIWHGIECSKPFYFCSFKFHLTPHHWSLFGTTFQRFQISKEARQYINLCSQYWKDQNPWASQQIASVLSLCLVEFLEQKGETPAKNDQLDEFRHSLWPLLETLLEEPSVHWNVGRMADELNLSADYFSRCFRRVIGQTPQRYILEATMRGAAASLLEVPLQPIKKIAERAGYGNVHAFTRAFTQVFRISPAAYRRQATSET
jgi:AraC-like DNA-binding protein